MDYSPFSGLQRQRQRQHPAPAPIPPGPGYTPTTFTKNLVVTLPGNGVRADVPTGLFNGQACARRSNPHCKARCEPHTGPCVRCETAPGCSASFAASFAHDGFSANVFWNAAARGLPAQGQFPGLGCLDCSNASWAEWRRRGFDSGSLVADPLFVDAASNDFRLAASSPARALGIESVDVSKCGPSW